MIEDERQEGETLADTIQRMAEGFLPIDEWRARQNRKAAGLPVRKLEGF